MGCIHYESAADEAQKKIDELNLEREKYVEARSQLREAARAIECYTSFLSSLDTAMGSVIVNGQPFDNGESKTHYTNLKNGVTTLNELMVDITEALREIANEIMALEPIVDARDNVCADCQVDDE